MQKQKENVFSEKFRLLNSQEHMEEINWSSSCSSDYEDPLVNEKYCNKDLRNRTMKRKRKTKVPKNKSSLSISILDTSRESKKVIYEPTSPILGCTSRRKSAIKSPILQPSQSFKKSNIAPSPILTSKTAPYKSPILVLKTDSPKSAVKVRKQLFNLDRNPVASKSDQTYLKLEEELIKKEDGIVSDIISCQSIQFEDEGDLPNGNMSKAKFELAKRVKSFFDSHFSSENTSLASQNSISEVLTPQNSTKTSDEIEIFTCKTQVLSNNNSATNIQSINQDSSTTRTESLQYDFNKNSRKIRHRKDGHAYRLNSLLKKQNAGLSLWQHERFLAANSNFVIPKGEFTVFRIQKVNFKYGCHLLQSVDANDDNYLILINNCYVSNIIVDDSVLKLYEPYRIVQYDDKSKLIINVTKYECSLYKKE